jgi:uncharacterized protein YdbL (DUF1318 family)
MKLSFSRLLLIVGCLVFGLTGSTGFAQDLGAVKSRMSERLPQVDQLKAKGVIGENNRGFLEARGSDAAAGAVISGENSDREAVYAALAKQSGSTADAVGKARAKHIAGSSAAGVWLQKEDGSWYKK